MKIIIYFLILCLCWQKNYAQTQFQLDSKTQTEVLQSISAVLNRNYVFPEKAKLMTDFLKKQQETNQYAHLKTPNAFANQILKDLRSIHKDKHLRIEYNPELEADILKFNTSKQDAEKVNQTDEEKDRQKNFHFKKVEILPSNIGYIEFTNFSKPNPAARKTANAALQFVANTDALIIDLRNNFGGDGTMAGEILSYFFNSKTLTGRSFNKIEEKWTDNFVENKKEITNGLVLSMPVYMLTSRRTFSAAEGLAYTLQSFQKAVIVGDTTRGGAHLTRSFSLGNGFVGFIPYQRGENIITKTDWEGIGVIPQIVAEESNSLMKTQTEILLKKLNTLTNEEEKRKVNWLINYYKSKDSKLELKTTEIEKFVGRFAEFEITQVGNELLWKDVNNHKTANKLIPITSTLFQFLQDYQVEFLFDEKGVCNAIRMYWDDGWVEDTKRTK